jgi:glycosyltransferase involved in cell wall biosynthesis
MRIAITADPEIPVPPQLYGGIERIIYMLIEGLVKQGHEVTLFAHPDSKTNAKLIPYKALGQGKMDVISNSLTITKAAIKGYDLIHSFGRLAYLLPLMPLSIPKIMSYQREPTISQIKLASRLSKKNSLVFTGCSEYIAAKIRPYAASFAIPNFVDTDLYVFKNTVSEDAPLAFLGRIEHIKGTHLAVQCALKTGRKLIIAGNIPSEPIHQAYFEKEVKPFIDGDQIQYVGPVNDQQKNDLLGKSTAFLMPVLWNEPFGIVMAEALACGTPIIALPGGATNEVVRENINGFMCKDLEGMIHAVSLLHTIDRADCRKICEQEYSNTAVIDSYLQLYQSMIKE